MVFTYDMVGYNDSRQLPHTFGGQRENLWGLSLAGLQLWNSIRALDFLQSLPLRRRATRIGVTGASGGGTQTFLLAAVDDRVAVAAPVNMISLHMQGGCLCENQPGLRLDTTNVEIAATIAPRPLLMVSATGDWTTNTMELEYPAVRALYALFDAAGSRARRRSSTRRTTTTASRARRCTRGWRAGCRVRRPTCAVAERSFTPDPLARRARLPPPAAARLAPSPPEQLTDELDCGRQARSSPRPLQQTRQRALRHALGYAADAARPVEQARARGPRTVVARQSRSRSWNALLKRERVHRQHVPFTPFDAEAAAKIRHFDTYNRTARRASASRTSSPPPARIPARHSWPGDAALAGVLAAAVAPFRPRVLDVGAFDTVERCRLRASGSTFPDCAAPAICRPLPRMAARPPRRAQRRRTIHAARREGRSSEAHASRDRRAHSSTDSAVAPSARALVAEIADYAERRTGRGTPTS